VSREAPVRTILGTDAGARATALAAVAAACAIALPVASLLGANDRDLVAASVAAVLILVAFPAGVLTLRRFRHQPSAAPIAAAIVAVLSVSIGHVTLGLVVLRLLGAAGVALAAAALAFRDRRDPLAGEIAVGMAALGAEALVAAALPIRGWIPLLVVLSPAYVVASLASRAVTVWDEPGVEEWDRSRWRDRSRVGALGYVAAVLGTAATAIRGGVWEQLGVVVQPLAAVVVGLVLVVLEAVLGPVFWFVQRLHVDPRAFEAFLRRLRRGAQRTSELPHRSGGLGTVVGRILGVTIVLALAFVAYRVFRRFRPPDDEPERPDRGRPDVASSPLEHDPSVARGRRRHVLPDDLVRRWYAEVLLALRNRELRKDPASTPAEFLLEVGRTHPGLADDLAELTRAYEDVRYGSRTLDPSSLRALAGRRRSLLRAIRRVPRAAPPGAAPTAT